MVKSYSYGKGHSNKNLVNQLGIAGGGQDFFSPVWGGGQAFFCYCWGGVRHFLLTFYLFELYILYTFSIIYTLTLWVMEDSILKKFTRFARISLQLLSINITYVGRHISQYKFWYEYTTNGTNTPCVTVFF